MMRKFVHQIKSLDFMTPPVQLNIGGKSGVKTLFGVAMTAFYAGSIAIFSYIFLLSFLATDSPTARFPK